MRQSWFRGRAVTPETALKRAIKTLLSSCGWFVRHNLQGLGCYPGMPDLTATKDRVTIEIEAKSARGKQRPAQVDYQRALEAAGGRYLLIDDIDQLVAWLKENGETRI